MLATARFGVWKIPSRTRGSRRSRSITTKAASRSAGGGEEQQRSARTPSLRRSRSRSCRRSSERAPVIAAAPSRSIRPRLARPAGMRPGMSARTSIGDRHVDQEGPAPADPLGDHAAEEDACRAASRSGGTPDPHRLAKLARVGEEAEHERHRRRGDQSSADALQGSAKDRARRLSWARPATSEAPVRTTKPSVKIRRAPKWSARRPPRSSRPPNAIT